ncbi:MAG: hypothetical protein P1V20_32380, partial [Verrucomicrobiales bacterium]|nr:hypothetical protein [Verrucomicrobiales bacterium]
QPYPGIHPQTVDNRKTPEPRKPSRRNDNPVVCEARAITHVLTTARQTRRNSRKSHIAFSALPIQRMAITLRNFD